MTKHSKWLENLPPGNYTVKELVEITKLTPKAICERLVKNGATVISKKMGNKNMYYNVYVWKGMK